MTDSNDGWGRGGAFVLGGVLGGLAGYALRSNGFGGMPYATAATIAAGGVTGYGEGCDIARANARIDNIIAQNAQTEVINAIAGVNANVSQNAKDLYTLNIQELFAQQQSTQALNDQFCNINSNIAADGNATRAQIAAFQDRYMSDRINDLQAQNASLKSALAMAPLYSTVNGIQSTLNSVLCNPSVRCCCNNTPVSGTVSF